ncbi:MAG: DNA lyase [Candidatus Kapaibacterium sp.]|jgi:N-glycosylase/DNA lyase
MKTIDLPEPWLSAYTSSKPAIQQRLLDFSLVPADAYFYELAYCILTPQSSAKNADRTIGKLIADGFYELGFDPTSYLRDPENYIRFHNVKSARLLHVRLNFPEILRHLNRNTLNSIEMRENVIATVGGFGMKEASHFLRNIGVRGLAILDRHIFKHLTRLGVIDEIPKNAPTKKRYLEIEAAWHEFANNVGISLDELDLLFWSMETGEIRK